LGRGRRQPRELRLLARSRRSVLKAEEGNGPARDDWEVDLSFYTPTKLSHTVTQRKKLRV
jgi:hypothetical protein